MDISPDIHKRDSKMNRTLNSDNNYTGTYSYSSSQSNYFREFKENRTNLSNYQTEIIDRDLIRGS